MLMKDALKEMIHRSGMTQAGLARAAGYNTLSAVSTPIMKNNMNVTTLVKFANVMGYDLMLVRRNGAEPEYPIRIDASAEAE
jgi:hypothetical protein